MARIGQLNVEEHGTREVEFGAVRLLRRRWGETRATPSSPASPGGGDPYFARTSASRNPVFGYSIKTGNGFFIYGTNTQILQVPIGPVEPGDGVVRLRFDPLP
jgi:hypothetical protein